MLVFRDALFHLWFQKFPLLLHQTLAGPENRKPRSGSSFPKSQCLEQTQESLFSNAEVLRYSRRATPPSWKSRAPRVECGRVGRVSLGDEEDNDTDRRPCIR